MSAKLLALVLYESIRQCKIASRSSQAEHQDPRSIVPGAGGGAGEVVAAGAGAGARAVGGARSWRTVLVLALALPFVGAETPSSVGAIDGHCGRRRWLAVAGRELQGAAVLPAYLENLAGAADHLERSSRARRFKARLLADLRHARGDDERRHQR